MLFNVWKQRRSLACRLKTFNGYTDNPKTLRNMGG